MRRWPFVNRHEFRFFLFTWIKKIFSFCFCFEFIHSIFAPAFSPGIFTLNLLPSNKPDPMIVLYLFHCLSLLPTTKKKTVSSTTMVYCCKKSCLDVQLVMSWMLSK